MSDEEPKEPKAAEGTFQKDVGVDKPGIVGARWWHKSLMDEDKHVHRRRVLLGLAVGGGAVAAISALGVGIVKMVSGESVALASRKSLDMQRQYGWDFGARGTPLVFDGVSEEPFVRAQLQSLAQVMAPSTQGPNAKYAVPTLVESLLAVPTASLPDPEDGQPRPDGGPFRRLFEVLVPIHTPAMTRAYRAGEALARLAGWKQGLAVLVDMPGPEAAAFAAGAAATFEPVLLFDNWPHPHAVVPSHLALAALAYYQPRFATQKARVFEAPLFVLDRARTSPYAEASDRFDNRYYARMPRLENLAKDGVRALLYVVASPAALPEPADLNAVLSARPAAGAPAVEVRALALTDFEGDPSQPPDRLFYRGSTKGDATFWQDYSFEPRPDAAPTSTGAAATTKEHRFVTRAAPINPATATIGNVVIAATASGLIVAAALDRNRTLQRYANGWRQGSQNRFSSGGSGWSFGG